MIQRHGTLSGFTLQGEQSAFILGMLLCSKELAWCQQFSHAECKYDGDQAFNISVNCSGWNSGPVNSGGNISRVHSSGTYGSLEVGQHLDLLTLENTNSRCNDSDME